MALAVGAVFIYRRAQQSSDVPPLSVVHTIAGADSGEAAVRLTNPFGVVIGADATVYVTDGETGKLWRIAPDGSAKVLTENLDTPSAVALAPDGSLIVAETGAHVIRRVNPETGQASLVAGSAGRAGYADGNGAEALFNAPIGVAVGSDGQIFVADTYNDRIRKIDTSGNVSALAGAGEAGFADSEVGAEARFDTPCGIAVAPDGSLIVADTGNQRIRRVWQTGKVQTIAGTGERASIDGMLFTASFNEPTGIAVDADGTIYVADAGGAALRICGWGVLPQVLTIAGGNGEGFQDGSLEGARLNRPAGIAHAPDGTIIFTDTGNKLVRAVVGESRARGSQVSTDAFASLSLTAAQMRAASPPRWPYEPPDRSREIAATFGEIRGELSADDKEAWFHNGLDIPGAYGERVRAVRTERVLNPFSVEDVGTTRERIRFPTLGYIHLRVGRDVSDGILDEQKFLPLRDAAGRVTGMRVRRGTRFAVGETIGTLNNQNHVHLIAGYTGAEFNALAALELPGVRDTVAPTIEKDGVRFYDAAWDEIRADASTVSRSKETAARLNLEGDVRIVVRAYDQMDGNAARRRLGLYRLGYQALTSDGAPVQGFNEPLVTISFESLPHDESAAQLAYAAGSKSGATGQTIFAYIVTNIVRDRAAREGLWEASKLPAGDYLLRVFAEDFFGNRTTHDTPVRVSSQSR
ncbi:MAG: SMP-30/gluconolactonase/LRE family protein [Pyrinomonadaceae bacterium]|nr:SMP-30/gluconolactonase/LRE family protein [Pyrinomonadaceae bacterium]